jgi:hypothetical protein
MVRIIKIDPREVDLPEVMVLARLGFKGTKRIPEEFKEIYQKALDMVIRVSKPLAVVKTLPCYWNHDLRVLDKKLRGRLVKRYLKDCERVTMMLVTLGEDVDLLIERAHREGNELLSFFIDSVASEFVECAARKVDSMLREKKYVSGARISPGYGDLSLRLNRWFVEELDGERFGIKVIEGSYMFLPRKTISAFIGWRKRVEQKKDL